MSADFHIIIPARFGSSRFPGKLLQDLNGLSVLERVYKQAQLTNPKSIAIATDHESIANHAKDFGAKVMMTSADHPTGTDRIAEVVAKGDYQADDLIVNVQGDEPFIRPALIQQVAASLHTTKAPVATLCWPITGLDTLNNPNVVKVVRTQDEHALYFSRCPIPFHRDEKQSFAHAYKHIGLYAYRAAFLLDFVSWSSCALEQCEALEQLRVLWAGFPIKVEVACEEPLQDINTLEDLEIAKQLVI
ncbi:3-deoxy-manno-octulosonate cytidylyltransferase [Legionella waltersii]|uniref:3-deoxy-manno-octulosonate cytidylyltransferase n=1 Tax=Legionella waltersii TaxID=66969 RepID=A0A0W1AMD9_9GAMM|nr:3-deoxy-manno-octulosonate cytidylyltransferase [Legionella waltersii]KTD82495.1 3-deoxy-manno-octulosonate cytidylyltransferase [Legionella waltersii]SNV02871.1 3-deoxy-manno-octulosonate cytidylyltransferase [Legionella waltersii]